MSLRESSRSCPRGMQRENGNCRRLPVPFFYSCQEDLISVTGITCFLAAPHPGLGLRIFRGQYWRGCDGGHSGYGQTWCRMGGENGTGLIER